MRVMARLSTLWRGFLRYIHHPDPRVAAANGVALLVALDQPFYPLYIWGIVGFDGWASSLTFLSTPLFALVPWVSRRAPRLARAMLPVVGVANTMLTAKAFGPACGVELFLFPCAMAGAMAFRKSERPALLATLGFVFASYFVLHGRLGEPLHVFDADALARFLKLNIYSVAGLTGLIALRFSGAD
jgi:hypothetical protein